VCVCVCVNEYILAKWLIFYLLSFTKQT